MSAEPLSSGHDIRGYYPIVPTPFRANESLDLDSLGRLVEYLIGSGVSGICVVGVASEGYALTDREKRLVISTAFERAAGRVPVFAGCFHQSGAAAAELGRQAQDAGAAVLMVMPPHFAKPTAKALLDYYVAVAQAVSVPIMIQDNPSWTGVALPPALIAELAMIPGVGSAKIETVHPPTTMRELSGLVSKDFAIIGGAAGNWLIEEHRSGSSGTMPASIMPQVFRSIWRDLDAGESDRARAVFDRYHPAVRVTMHPTVGFAMVKHLLWRLGIIECAAVRNPLQPLSAGNQEDFEAVVQELDLLGVMSGQAPVAA